MSYIAYYAALTPTNIRKYLPNTGHTGCPGSNGFAQHAKICHIYEHHLSDRYSEIFTAIRIVLLMVIKD